LWLNVASSHYVLPDFVNLDNHVVLALLRVYPLLRPFLTENRRKEFRTFREARTRAVLRRHDCRKPLPFPSGSVDHVLCSHFLEHVYPSEAVTILADFRRVLRNGGTLHVIVPDLKTLIDAYVSRAAEAEAVDKLITASCLSFRNRPSLRYRVLEFLGYEGLKHRWMYTQPSMTQRLVEAGFRLLGKNATPSWEVHAEDGALSLHLVAEKV